MAEVTGDDVVVDVLGFVFLLWTYRTRVLAVVTGLAFHNINYPVLRLSFGTLQLPRALLLAGVSFAGATATTAAWPFVEGMQDRAEDFVDRAVRRNDQQLRHRGRGGPRPPATRPSPASRT